MNASGMGCYGREDGFSAAAGCGCMPEDKEGRTTGYLGVPSRVNSLGLSRDGLFLNVVLLLLRVCGRSECTRGRRGVMQRWPMRRVVVVVVHRRRLLLGPRSVAVERRQSSVRVRTHPVGETSSDWGRGRGCERPVDDLPWWVRSEGSVVCIVAGVGIWMAEGRVEHVLACGEHPGVFFVCTDFSRPVGGSKRGGQVAKETWVLMDVLLELS